MNPKLNFINNSQLTNTAQLATLLDGRIAGEETNDEIIERAENNNLVIVFGYSDDNVEFRGAINDELSSWGGSETAIDNNGIIEGCENNCIHSQKAIKNAKIIKAEYSGVWKFETTIPHSIFKILLPNGNVFSYGIVFNLKILE